MLRYCLYSRKGGPWEDFSSLRLLKKIFGDDLKTVWNENWQKIYKGRGCPHNEINFLMGDPICQHCNRKVTDKETVARHLKKYRHGL